MLSNNLSKNHIISFDIGIKNMCYCIIEPGVSSNSSNSPASQLAIMDWKILNLLETPDTPEERVCECGKKAKYVKYADADDANETVRNEIYYCTKDAKKTGFSFSGKKLNFNKMGKPELVEYCRSNRLVISASSANKHELVEIATNHEKYNSLKPIEKACVAGAMDLIQIGRNMKRMLDHNIPDEQLNKIGYVVIENQISPIATRMKTIQGMLAQYFIMRGITDVVIDFVSSKNKLKGFVSLDASTTTTTLPRDKYKKNKKDGIAYCSQMIEQNETIKRQWGWALLVPKKDDYADCFLQGVWYLRERVRVL